MDVRSAAKARALGRAKACAWIVAISMAGTTIIFQTYHSIWVAHLPWLLGGLYGIVPLLISMCILEVVAEWENAPDWAKGGAYLIMAGSMFLSAFATGNVVLRAAPPHMELMFGILLDAACLLAVHFILNGPTGADVSRQAAAEDQRRAEEKAALRAEAEELRQQRHADRESADARAAEIAAAKQAAINDLQAKLDEANDARSESERDRERLQANVDRISRRIEANGRTNRTRAKGEREGRPKGEPGIPKDVAARSQALQIWNGNPDIAGAELGRLCGMTPRWGQMRIKEFSERPAGPDGNQTAAADGTQGLE